MVGDYRFHYDVDAHRRSEGTTINALCAVVVEGEIQPNSRAVVLGECKKQLLLAIARVSQTSRESPYRAAGENETRWATHYATIATGDLIFVMDGIYVLPPSVRPCIFISNCCDQDGALQLRSCRTPTAHEKPAIVHCQKDDGVRSCAKRTMGSGLAIQHFLPQGLNCRNARPDPIGFHGCRCYVVEYPAASTRDSTNNSNTQHRHRKSLQKVKKVKKVYPGT